MCVHLVKFKVSYLNVKCSVILEHNFIKFSSVYLVYFFLFYLTMIYKANSFAFASKRLFLCLLLKTISILAREYSEF